MYVHNMFEDYSKSRKRGSSLPVNTSNICFVNGELFENIGFEDTKSKAYKKAEKIKSLGKSVLIKRFPSFYRIYRSYKVCKNPVIKYEE